MTNKGVNRLEQIEKIRNLLDKIQEKPEETDKVVINWYGVPGIGKSRLGFMIGLQCEQKKIPFARVDFDPEENPSALRYAEDPLSIFRDIYTELTAHWPARFPALPEAADEAEEIDFFHQSMETGLKETPAAILFDTTEKADKRTISWVEKFIIGPLCTTGRCVLIWTGRFPQVWRRFEIRQKAVDPEKLTSLTAKYTKEQIGPSGAEIYRLTFGHPLANEHIAEAMAPMEKEPDDKEKLKSLLHDFIDRFIFRDISQRMKSACRTLCVIRQFDVMFFEEILVEFSPDYFMGETEFMGVLAELRSTSLLEWDTTLKGFSLDETIRRFLARYLQLTERKAFLAISARASEIYSEWIDLNPENRSVYFKEKLFHLINIGNSIGKTKNEISEICLDEINKYFQHTRATPSALMQLHEEIEKDVEFKELAGPKVFRNMLSAIDSRKQELAGLGNPVEKKQGCRCHA